MIRLNVFLTLRPDADRTAFMDYATELVAQSRLDEGNIAYDIFQSATSDDVMMICETWRDEAALAAHSASEHFTRLVPALEKYTVAGLKLESFDK